MGFAPALLVRVYVPILRLLLQSLSESARTFYSKTIKAADLFKTWGKLIALSFEPREFVYKPNSHALSHVNPPVLPILQPHAYLHVVTLSIEFTDLKLAGIH